MGKHWVHFFKKSKWKGGSTIWPWDCLTYKIWMSAALSLLHDYILNRQQHAKSLYSQFFCSAQLLIFIFFAQSAHNPVCVWHSTLYICELFCPYEYIPFLFFLWETLKKNHITTAKGCKLIHYERYQTESILHMRTCRWCLALWAVVSAESK